MSKDMVEVIIDSIRVSLMSQQRIVILREVGADRYLPIWIGIYEAEAITISLQEVEVARPLTHDLLKNVFQIFDAQILRVEVSSLREDTYFGNIVVEVDSRVVNIDARPSDALNLAVRTHVPIFVAKDVMDVAGVIPEQDLQEDTLAESKPLATRPAEADSDVTDDRLSIFEDFLDKLDLNEDTDKGEEDKPE